MDPEKSEEGVNQLILFGLGAEGRLMNNSLSHVTDDRRIGIQDFFNNLKSNNMYVYASFLLLFI